MSRRIKNRAQGWHPGHPLTRSDFMSITLGPKLEEYYSNQAVKERRQLSKRPKCPRCRNKQPARQTCTYCGGQGRV